MHRYAHMCMHTHKYTPLALPHSEGWTRHNLGIYPSITQACAKAAGTLRAHGLEDLLLSSPSMSFGSTDSGHQQAQLSSHNKTQNNRNRNAFFKKPASFNQGLRGKSNKEMFQEMFRKCLTEGYKAVMALSSPMPEGLNEDIWIPSCRFISYTLPSFRYIGYIANHMIVPILPPPNQSQFLRNSLVMYYYR